MITDIVLLLYSRGAEVFFVLLFYLMAFVSVICRGSVVAKIVGYNVLARPEKFVREVPMYVYEEMIDGRKLTEIINTQHENVKYLPGCVLPDNVVGLFCRHTTAGYLFICYLLAYCKMEI